MKTSLLCIAPLFPLAVFGSHANLFKQDISEDTLAEITSLLANVTRDAQTKRQLGLGVLKPGFDANAQRVSTSGIHRYIEPGPNDKRGPCPGLNVMANHGYIARNGVASVVELTTASNEVFGMGLDLAAALSVYSGIMSGDITSVSIGGKPTSGLLSSLGLLGQPQGLSLSHNNFEMDGSPTRADLYKSNDPVSLDLSQFEQLLEKPLGPNGYDLSVMFPFRGERFKNSVATNGRFFAGPFALIVTSATYLFTYNLFSNFSAEYPTGYLDAETLKSFEGVTGEKGSYEWGSGRERIPENWYRRAIGDDYTIPAAFVEIASMLRANPFTAVVGGNTGQPYTFTGVNLSDLTGGVYNAETLLEGDNAACFAFQFLQVATPDILNGSLGNIALALQRLTQAFRPVFASLACPAVGQFEPGLLNSFPGYNR